jgi:ectoine hydroxylase-related dioxygenase (phytanoyl-CoA dioxygenase family)
MLQHIDQHIRELAGKSVKGSLEEIVGAIDDDKWSKKMHRAFRMFPDALAKKIYDWADQNVRVELGKNRCVVNAVSAEEFKMNPKLGKSSLVVYWRCVRPGKPDAGRPHRDATFWVVELNQGYDPQIPFPFDYVKDCLKIWIPLQGCVPTTTLQIIPKSHRMDIGTTIQETDYGVRPSIEESWLKAHEKEFMSPLELSQGSCIIFDMDLVHKGPAHNNDQLRISAELTLIFQ